MIDTNTNMTLARLTRFRLEEMGFGGDMDITARFEVPSDNYEGVSFRGTVRPHVVMTLLQQQIRSLAGAKRVRALRQVPHHQQLFEQAELYSEPNFHLDWDDKGSDEMTVDESAIYCESMYFAGEDVSEGIDGDYRDTPDEIAYCVRWDGDDWNNWLMELNSFVKRQHDQASIALGEELKGLLKTSRQPEGSSSIIRQWRTRDITVIVREAPSYLVTPNEIANCDLDAGVNASHPEWESQIAGLMPDFKRCMSGEIEHSRLIAEVFSASAGPDERALGRAVVPVYFHSTVEARDAEARDLAKKAVSRARRCLENAEAKAAVSA